MELLALHVKMESNGNGRFGCSSTQTKQRLKAVLIEGEHLMRKFCIFEPNPRTHRESLGKRERSSELSETAWRHNGCMKLYESARPSQVFTVCTCF